MRENRHGSTSTQESRTPTAEEPDVLFARPPPTRTGRGGPRSEDMGSLHLGIPGLSQGSASAA